MTCTNTYKGEKHGVLIYDGVTHAEWHCSLSCFVIALEGNGFTNDEIVESIADNYYKDYKWSYDEFSTELIKGVTPCRSTI